MGADTGRVERERANAKATIEIYGRRSERPAGLMDGRERGAVQDAFHYAVRACGGSWQGHESAIGDITRSEAFRRSLGKAREAFGAATVRAWALPRLVGNAPALAKLVHDAARARQVDASMGEPLCTRCNERGCCTRDTGLCVYCPESEGGAVEDWDCLACGGHVVWQGTLGKTEHGRCRGCGVWVSR